MSGRNILKEWVLEALHSLGGQAKVIQVAQRIWEQHKDELDEAGNLFYTWQYDMRWAAKVLRDEGRLMPAKDVPRGIWAVTR